MPNAYAAFVKANYNKKQSFAVNTKRISALWRKKKGMKGGNGQWNLAVRLPNKPAVFPPPFM